MSTSDVRFLSSIEYDPEWRHLEARSLEGENSVDPYVRRYAAFLTSENKLDDIQMCVAHEIYNNKWYRCRIEAYLIAESSPEEIARRFDISPDAVKCYSALFFDLSPLHGSGSRSRVAEDPKISQELRDSRKFGLRYGKLLLDWYISNVETFSPEERENLTDRLESILHMKAFELDDVSPKNKETYSLLLKTIDTLTKFLKVRDTSKTSDELDEILGDLKTMVVRKGAPMGLPIEILNRHIAKPKNNNE